jgi:Methyltransferase domain
MNDVACQLEWLAQRYPMNTKSRRLTKLQPHHIPDFDNSDGCLLDELARVVCPTRCIPRKELFEAWAMALYVQEAFPECQRVADLASGHGLLSWALLALANDNSSHRSAVCIDIQMPLAAEILQHAMEDHWPVFKGQWDYVQGKLECLEPDPSTLLLGVHCCGVLSDRIIDLTIQGNCPLALVPCCHSRKCLGGPDQWKDLDEASESNITDYIDSQRIQQLRAAGFTVWERTIPKLFTPKNRIILATPPPQPVVPPCIPKWKLDKNHPPLCIPVANTPNAKAVVRSLAGRAAAQERDKLPPIAIIVPLSYGSKNPDVTAVTAEQLQSQVVTPHCQALEDPTVPLPPPPLVEALHAQPVTIQKTGLVIQNFQIVYDSNWNNPFALHIQICHKIDTLWKGVVTVRPLPQKVIRQANERNKTKGGGN